MGAVVGATFPVQEGHLRLPSQSTEHDERRNSSALRYPVLDGIRGVAAIAVVLFHVGNWVHLDLLFPRGYLAVDFFLCLSGFVVCGAYGERAAAGMSFGAFMRIRLIRLYPLIALGILLGFLVYFGREIALGTNLLSPGEWLSVTGLNLLLLPYLHVTPLGESAFPLNVVAWSLFAEILVNVVWFVWLRRTAPLVQAVVMLLSGAAIVMLMMRGFTIDDQVSDVDVFGIGLFRAFFSFFLGALIHRFRATLVPRTPALSAWTILLVFTVLMAVPVNDNLRIYEATFLFLASPALMILSLKARCTSATLMLCRAGERISYPIYALHRPLFLALLYGFNLLGIEAYRWTYVALGLVLALCVATLAERLYDRPIRSALAALSRQRPPVALTGTA